MTSVEGTATGSGLVASLGLDVGTARITIATGPVGTTTGPSPIVRTAPTAVAATSDGGHGGPGSLATAVARFLGGLLSGPDAIVAVDPGRTAVVVAVPDTWLTPTSAIPTVGATLQRLLIDDLRFTSPRLVNNMVCAAAAHTGTTPRIQLLCDIGAHTITGAVCATDERTVRLLDIEEHRLDENSTIDEHLSVDESVYHRTLLDWLLAGRTVGTTDRARLGHALEDERRRRDRRAVLVLERAVEQPRYLGTPVYLSGVDSSGEHGSSLTADVVLRALTPLAALAHQVVERLMSRIAEPVHPEIVVTGRDALPPVVEAVVTAAGGRDRRTSRIDPTAAARGALHIAAGRIVAEDGYPHTLGLALRRIRHGLLESVTVAITGPGQVEPLVVRIESNDTEPLPVRVRLYGEGPWLVAPAATTNSVPPGTYRVAVLAGRSGLGALLLHPVGGGEPVIHPLAATAGPAEAPPHHLIGRNP